MSAKKASEEALAGLHSLLAESFTKIIKDGVEAIDREGKVQRVTPSPAFFKEAREFLKDNGVEVIPGASKPLQGLAEVLDVQVRSAWASVGETLTPDEFAILLCTGGPAVRIRGELGDYAEPDRAWIEYQDWFEPWAEYHGDNASQETLLTYCRQFYFGC